MPRAHNGKHITGAKRERILALLAQGEPISTIRRALSHSDNSVRAIRDECWRDLAQRKALLASQAERGALLAGEKVIAAVQEGKINGSALIPAYGVFVDKALALRPHEQPQQPLQIQVEHKGNIFHAFAQFHADVTRQLHDNPATNPQQDIIEGEIVGKDATLQP